MVRLGSKRGKSEMGIEKNRQGEAVKMRLYAVLSVLTRFEISLINLILLLNP